MCLLVKLTLSLFILLLNNNSYPHNVVNPVLDPTSCVNVYCDSTLAIEHINQEGELKTIDYAERTYKVNLYGLIATILGILTALGTLIWMHCNSKKENSKVQKQIELLEQNNKQSKEQIENQKQTLENSSEQSKKLNAALTESVNEINQYLTKSELKTKLIEKKDTVQNTFSYLWNSCFLNDTAQMIEGTLIKNQAVLNGLISIVNEIASFNDLHPRITKECVEKGTRCTKDLEELTTKKMKGYDPAAWLQSSKQHFTELEQEMTNCINNL